MWKMCVLCVSVATAVPQLAIATEDVLVNGVMTVGKRDYKLTAVRAFRIKSVGKESIAVIVSQKPVSINNPMLFPNKSADSGRWIDLESISSTPHMQLIFDADGGKLRSYQGWAKDTTFIGFEDLKGESPFGGEGRVDGSMIRGSAKWKGLKGLEASSDATFDFNFRVVVEDLKNESHDGGGRPE